MIMYVCIIKHSKLKAAARNMQTYGHTERESLKESMIEKDPSRRLPDYDHWYE